ncbi:MAG: twin-arginine translocation signal domain-containing protein [Selenomonadaceae bacterium]|nr:twin-arginine translocation signal domain-containing protein [Selenomonadaceae bacterium]
MDITRRNFVKLATTAGLMLTFGKVSAATNEKILVVYYSRTGEEYGLGNITKGNTAIIAELIAQKTGGDLFEIKPVTPYPDSYEECKKVASREKATKARPPFIGNVDISGYDIIFCGYPIWYGDAPQIVYTFLEGHDFSGKKIVPFCTHGGSGLSSTDQNIMLTCPTAKILQGFAIQGSIAQNNPSKAAELVDNNLKKLALI